MGLYRDEAGLVFEADDQMADAMGYSPVSAVEEQDIYAERGLKSRAEERGALGAVTAGATGLLSGGTLGLSDVFLGQGLSDGERQALLADIEAHPYIRGAGELVGGIATGVAAPGSALSKTPTGYLSSLASQQVEYGLAKGGIGGTARALGAMGAEGGLQSIGQYVGYSALEDKEVTAEGLAGALGTGYAFGTLGGGVALGVAKGTMAARKMYSRVMDGQQGAKSAESSWSLASQEALDADTTTAQAARDRLDAIQAAKREALKYRNEARAMTQEEQIYAQANPQGNSQPRAPGTIEGIEPAAGGMPTSIRQRPEPVGPHSVMDAAEFDSSLPTMLDDGAMVPSELMAPARDGGQTAIKKVEYTPDGTKITGTRKLPKEGTEVPKEGTLEAQLAGTKAEIDSGKPLKDIKASKGNDSNSVERWLGEKKAGDVTKITRPQYDYPLRPEMLPTKRAPFSNLRTQLGKLADANQVHGPRLPEVRYERTAELLGSQIADEEARLAGIVDDFEAAKEALKRVDEQLVKSGELTADELATLRQDNPTMGKPRQRAMEVLDNAHEEALLSAQSEIDPVKAGEWLRQAEQIEDMMINLPDGDDVYWNLKDGIEVVTAYEKAAAKLADEMGDAAHPVTTARAKALADAERDTERKMYDRTTRAVDDEVEYGPTYKTPKERVTYAKERQLDAQRALDDVSAQELEAKDYLGKADKKVKAGEKLKKDTLRAEAKAAKAGGALGATEKIGMLDMLDLPSMPKVSDLPVVGPLLGAWLKFRVMKAALGRKMGRVAATPDARVAALASRTRDRVARAVDRSLGALEVGGKQAYRNAPRMAGILAGRIYDDGEPDAPKKAPIGEQAAVRVRELAAYVHTPGAIERDVRMQLRGVSDPDLIAAAEAHRRAAMEYLLSVAPKAPEQAMMKTIKWQPSPAQAMSFARSVDAVNDPAGVFERTADQRAMLSMEAADALRAVYPQMFLQAQQRVQERIAMQQAMIPYRQRVQMSLLYKLPLDASLQPDNLKITQSVYERKVMAPPAGVPATPPTPSVAQPTNVTALYQNPADTTR